MKRKLIPKVMGIKKNKKTLNPKNNNKIETPMAMES
jgi:hypothetical protein